MNTNNSGVGRNVAIFSDSVTAQDYLNCSAMWGTIAVRSAADDGAAIEQPKSLTRGLEGGYVDA